MFGTPTEEDIAGVDQVKARQFLRFMRKKEAKALEKVFPGVDPLMLDLLKKMLTFNPKKRITVEEALRHPYLADLYCPEDEPTRDFVSIGEFEYEKHDLQLQGVKDLLYEEILLYHFSEFRQEYAGRVIKYEEMGRQCQGKMMLLAKENVCLG